MVQLPHFFSGQNAHPKHEEIVATLTTLWWEMSEVGVNFKINEIHDIFFDEWF